MVIGTIKVFIVIGFLIVNPNFYQLVYNRSSFDA